VKIKDKTHKLRKDQWKIKHESIKINDKTIEFKEQKGKIKWKWQNPQRKGWIKVSKKRNIRNKNKKEKRKKKVPLTAT